MPQALWLPKLKRPETFSSIPPEYEKNGDRVDFATTLSIPDGSQDVVIEAFEAYLKATPRGHFKYNKIASLLHGYKLDLGWTQPDDEEAKLIPPV